MSHSIAPAHVRSSARERADGSAARASWRIGLVAAAFFMLWLQVVNHLRLEWTVNPQYGYGWTVPFLALFLFYKRWQERPAPAAPKFRLATILVATVAAIPLLPARLVSIANPDWRLISWILALAALVISLCALNLAGGVRWVRHFGFPVAFFLVATPWPAQFEQTVVQGLMRADAALVVQVLNAIGTVALQRGNVIELSTGLVGIADACTGIRSLQSTLMISLFLGEFYRMTVPRRVTLLAAAAALAFICNLGRTLLLCLIASASSIDAIHAWHDSAGLTILLVCIFGLWLLSLRLAKEVSTAPVLSIQSTSRPKRNYWGWAVALALWIGCSEIFAASWYHVRGAGSAKLAPWSVIWPTNQKEYAITPVPDVAKDLLLYDEGGGANWVGDDEHRWLMYYFNWLPGRTAALSVKTHRPDICLPASGMTLRSETGLQVLSMHGVRLPFRAYRFDAGGQNVDVFYCYWDGRSSYDDDSSGLKEDWSAGGRIAAAWKGQREIGARMVELVVTGYEDEAEAREALRRQLNDLISPR